jgi:molybdate transport system substrate-binding protein
MTRKPFLFSLTGILLIGLMLTTLVGCAQPVQAPQPTQPAQPTQPPQLPKTLTVFAAASLTESFTEIGKQFEADNPGVKVVFNFAGSQQLRAQLEQGAKADVFASANTKEMTTAIISDSLVVSGTQHTFVTNRLAVILPKSNPGKITSLADLARPGLKLDFADPSVPVGQYALDVLTKMSQDATFGAAFKDMVVANVVSREDNVKSVVAKVRLGEADAGVVYTTDITPDAAKELTTLDVPDKFNVIATYPIAPLKDAAEPKLAGQFVDWVLSKGQQVLTQYGFIPVATAKP